MILESNKLYFNWNNITTLLMTPLESDLFIVDGMDDFRIKIVSENNLVTAIKRIYRNGQERIYKKD